MYLFDTLIKPIILYMSDFWGCLLPRKIKNNPIDITQNKFLKQMLGVQVQTSTFGMLLETGRVPLSLFAEKYCIKNWERIATKKCNILVEVSYKNSIEENLVWSNSVNNSLSTNGMRNLFYNNQSDVHNIYFSRVVDIFHQNAFADNRREDSKLRTYSHLKTDIGIEPYLGKIKNIKNRTMFTKFRLSNHNLMIEKGRHQNIDKNSRFCPFCPYVIEDEVHFLMKCPCFETHRKLLFKRIIDQRNIPHFNSAGTFEQFKILMTNPNVVPETANLINNTMRVRDFLIAKHKNNS